MISWFATLLSIAGILLNARKHMWCWPIWIMSNIVWIYYFTILNPLDSAVVLNVVFTVVNIYGWWSWSKINGFSKVLNKEIYEGTPNTSHRIATMERADAVFKRSDNYVQGF